MAAREQTGSVPEVRSFVAGAWLDGTPQPLRSPFDGRVAARIHHLDPERVRRAVARAREAFRRHRDTPAHVRADWIARAAERLAARRDELAELMALHGGKPLREGRGEVERSFHTLRVSAEEAKRLGGEVLPLDAVPSGEGVLGFTLRLPLGVIAGISPFNAPLNLACHKVGPALAAGNAIVLKPHPAGAAVAAALAEAFAEAGLPEGLFAVVQGDVEAGDALVTHPEIDLVSFTGSGPVAEAIVRRIGLVPSVLELGGNAPTLIHRDADLDSAVPQCVRAAFGLAGQSCVSTQRLYLHEEIADAFTERFVAAARALRPGDPRDESTDVGPLVNEAAAARVAEWIDEAVAGGATLHCGGGRDGALLEPTVLSGVDPAMRVVCDEVFGPVVSILRYRDLDEAIAAANASPWGLKAGVFTASLDVALRAARELESGTVNVNAPSRSRTDIEPSGGIKRSGWGKEGPRWAIETMTRLTMVSLKPSR